MASSDRFSMGFDTGPVSEKIAAYQSKLLEMAKANFDLSFSYAKAIAAVKSPAEFTTISGDYSRRQVEMFKSQTKELTSFTLPERTF
jgi:hypothetical protein